MKELKLLNQFLRVKAPPDFEEKVWERYLARKKKKQRTRRLTYILGGSLAAAAATLLVVFWLISPGHQPYQGASWEENKSESVSWSVSSQEVIPITEPVIYTNEFSPQPRRNTIYILEPIADTPGRPIKY